jgi:hypothetical protein
MTLSSPVRRWFRRHFGQPPPWLPGQSEVSAGLGEIEVVESHPLSVGDQIPQPIGMAVIGEQAAADRRKVIVEPGTRGEFHQRLRVDL